VLLGNRQRSAGPALPHRFNSGRQDLIQKHRTAQSDGPPLQYRLKLLGVEAAHRTQDFTDDVRRSGALAIAGRENHGPGMDLLLEAFEVGQRKAANPGDAVTLPGELAQQAEPLDVAIGIEALAAFRSVGSYHSVAPLPGPEDVGRQAGEIRHQADGMPWVVEATVWAHSAILSCCLVNVNVLLTHKLDKIQFRSYFLRRSLDRN